MIGQIGKAVALPEFNDLGRSVTDIFSTDFLLPRELGTTYKAYAYGSRQLFLRILMAQKQETVQPTFVSPRIKQHLEPREVNQSIVDQQSLVYQFKCDLCDAGYVGYTRRHLHQRVDEHKKCFFHWKNN